LFTGEDIRETLLEIREAVELALHGLRNGEYPA